MENSWADELGRCWDMEEGFFYKLRQGDFDEDAFVKFMHLLRSVSYGEDALIPKAIVSQLWFIPLFMEWQTERVTKKMSPDRYNYARTSIENELERILGMP